MDSGHRDRRCRSHRLAGSRRHAEAHASRELRERASDARWRPVCPLHHRAAQQHLSFLRDGLVRTRATCGTKTRSVHHCRCPLVNLHPRPATLSSLHEKNGYLTSQGAHLLLCELALYYLLWTGEKL